MKAVTTRVPALQFCNLQSERQFQGARPAILQFVICNNLQSAICNLQSAICNLQSAICNLQSAICNLQFAICNNLVVAAIAELQTWHGTTY